MRILVLACLLGSLFFLGSGFMNPGKKLAVTCKMNGCVKMDSLYMFEFNGVVFNKIMSTPKKEDGSFRFEIPLSKNPRFYYIGNAINRLKPIILGTEKEVLVTGPCLNFRAARVQNSDINRDYNALKALFNKYNNELKALNRQYQMAKRNPQKATQVAVRIKTIDEKRLHLLDSLKKEKSYLAHVAAFNTYLSFQNHGQKYPNEVQYFADEYFKYVDWKNEAYEYLPWVYESTKTYSTTLSSLQLPHDQHKAVLENLLKKIPEHTRTYKLAFGGILSGMQQKDHPNYLHFGELFIQKYKKDDMLASVEVRRQINRIKATVVGGEAPDFSMATPEGTDLSLSEFRGKYLLVDFWASWCGPCRRENPNVLKMYKKYKEKDFDILAVSLDRQKNRWLQAIEKDGLIWHHVSDLKGWQNSAAKLYGVRAIPHTVLVDKDGTIIARNLRGPALEAKLMQIFGE